MAKPSKDRPSPETVAEAQRIARANQRPGQTKEQTKLIAQGIQKGIDQYKKQQKVKARVQDKRRKTATAAGASEETSSEPFEESVATTWTSRLPWILLGLSWAGFLFYLLFIGQ